MPANFNAYNPNFNPGLMNYGLPQYAPQTYQPQPQQYLAPVPRPAYVVQNPNCCGNYFNACACAANA